MTKRLLLFIFLACSLAATVRAVELTAEQQAKLDALPPNLRSQAMAELQKFEANNASSKPIEQPEVVKPSPAPSGSGDSAGIEKQFEEGTDITNTAERPTTKTVRADLKQFGYDLFAGVPTTFAPATDIPIPADYIIGPGDQIRLQFFGKDIAGYDLYISREGVLQIPELGPLNAAGQSFSELKADISKRVSEQLIGTEAFVTMGELRSVRVFVLGDASRPGAYTVSSLATMTNALFVSGGIRPIGSLRRVLLKRQGETVGEIDLYDLLLRGDTSTDARLQPGDVLFIPPVGELVGIAGEVRRPAIYEFKNETTVGELIEMAGGLTSIAYLPITQVERVSESGLKKLIDVDLADAANMTMILQDGDVVRIYPTLDRADNVVAIEGLVSRPGNYQWKEGLRVSDVIRSYEDLLPSADTQYSLVVSRSRTTGKISVQSFSLAKVLKATGAENDIELKALDRVIVFDQTGPKRDGLDKILDGLRTQATSGAPEKIVEVSGQVRNPGAYPLESSMKVGDLIQAAGGYSQEAYTLQGELIRYDDNGKERRGSAIVDLDLTEETENGTGLPLLPFDQLNIQRIPEWNERESISISGEVRFPGSYTIERGETMSGLVERAGGFTSLAHPPSAVFLRESLKVAEEEQMRKLRARLEEDLAAAKISDSISEDSISTAESLLSQMELTEAVGRLVIDLEHAMSASGSTVEGDVALQNGDRLVIPQKPQSVSVIGSVNFPTSHLYEKGRGRDEYIDLSGGLLKRADRKQIYVVRANGKVIASSRSRFFPNENTGIQAGDTIVVPIDINRIRPLKLWTDISQIIYQIALGAAAVNSF